MRAVFMDLDGTTVLSEPFWISLLEQTLRKLLGANRFTFEEADLPHVSGRPVSAHLAYALSKYCPDRSLEDARGIHTRLSEAALAGLLDGTGECNDMRPHPGVKDLLLDLKARNIPVALVTSGTAGKAWSQLVATFRNMNLGDPHEAYAAIVCGGQAICRGRMGTLGELAAKPHPWLYSEAAHALGLLHKDLKSCLGIEDTPTGGIAVRLAGLPLVAATGGAIRRSGLAALALTEVDDYRTLIDLFK